VTDCRSRSIYDTGRAILSQARRTPLPGRDIAPHDAGVLSDLWGSP